MALQEMLSQLVNENTNVSSSEVISSSISHQLVNQAFLSSTDSSIQGSLAGSKTVYLPEPVVTQNALLLLNGKSKVLVNHLTDMMVRERYRSNIQPKRLEVTVHVDSETGKRLLHIKQTVATNADRALDYWNRLADPIDIWINSLPREQKEFVLNDIYMTIHWTD